MFKIGVDEISRMPVPYRLRLAAAVVEAVVYDAAGTVSTARLSELVLMAARLERIAEGWTVQPNPHSGHRLTLS